MPRIATIQRLCLILILTVAHYLIMLHALVHMTGRQASSLVSVLLMPNAPLDFDFRSSRALVTALITREASLVAERECRSVCMHASGISNISTSLTSNGGSPYSGICFYESLLQSVTPTVFNFLAAASRKDLHMLRREHMHKDEINGKGRGSLDLEMTHRCAKY